MEKCSICNEIKKNYLNNFFDKKYSKLISNNKNIIYETANFIVIPSIGALNESHIMICPKEHYISFSSIPNNFDYEILQIKNKLNNYCLKKTNKNLIFFEHGTGKNNKLDTCISHAHIHCIYENKNFEKKLFSTIKMFELPSYKDIHNKIDKINGYIFYKNNNKYWIANNPTIQSQFFRKIYIESNNTKLNWNWRISPNYHIINKVIEFYKEFL